MPRKDRECNRQYQAKWYKQNQKTQTARVQKRKAEMRLWFAKEKRKYKCVKCGEDHPACLDFHHSDPDAKEIELSSAAGRGWCKEKILLEIKKCIPLCANCHRKIHYDLSH